jgi:hypothetical protein
MAEPTPATTDQMREWAERDGLDEYPVTIGGPPEGPEVIPCPALLACDVHRNTHMVHVAWQLNELELAALAQGGTLWLTTWGGLPIHSIEVTP